LFLKRAKIVCASYEQVTDPNILFGLTVDQAQAVLSHSFI